MKRFVCLLLVLCLIPVCVFAEVVLSSMSFDELKALQQEINKEIVKRPEWKSVKVPSGTYTVGKEIPAGEYSIRMDKSGFYIGVDRPSLQYGSLIVNQGITSEDAMIAHIELIDGDIVKIQGATAIFEPAIALGF